MSRKVSGMEPTHTATQSPSQGLEERIAAFASLADPTRRRLYPSPLSPPGGGGRPACPTGRRAPPPAKTCRRSPKDLSFSVPQRNYELLARVLVEALTSGDE